MLMNFMKHCLVLRNGMCGRVDMANGSGVGRRGFLATVGERAGGRAESDGSRRRRHFRDGKGCGRKAERLQRKLRRNSVIASTNFEEFLQYLVLFFTDINNLYKETRL